MKSKAVASKDNPSKGERLNWTSRDQVKPVRLSRELTTGKSLNSRDLARQSNHNAGKSNLLLP